MISFFEGLKICYINPFVGRSFLLKHGIHYYITKILVVTADLCKVGTRMVVSSRESPFPSSLPTSVSWEVLGRFRGFVEFALNPAGN